MRTYYERADLAGAFDRLEISFRSASAAMADLTLATRRATRNLRRFYSPPMRRRGPHRYQPRPWHGQRPTQSRKAAQQLRWREQRAARRRRHGA